MKLEVGQFVRTKCGIEQIYRIDNNKTKYKYLYKLKKQDGDGCIDCGVLSSEDILKASYNIINLIEVGDYVNGSKVNIIENEFIYFDTGHSIHYEYIETIVTKEQFEAMQYKVV